MWLLNKISMSVQFYLLKSFIHDKPGINQISH